jgi:hypothetical protein
MKIMQRAMIVGMFSIVLALAVNANAQRSDEFNAQLDWYKSRYTFLALDTLYTMESEFVLPDGYHRPDSSGLSDWSRWISHFPLWHRFRPLNDWKGKRLAEADEVARVLYLPDHGTHLTPAAIPFRLAAEYLLWAGRMDELVITPKAGEPFEYSKWLSSKLAFGARGAVIFKPSETRPSSPDEFKSMVKRAMEVTTCESLARNCVAIEDSDVSPGDLYMSWDSASGESVVLVLMYMLENDRGDRMFAVATGCDDPCDVHVPFFTHDRNDPWLKLSEIEKEVPNHGQQGFYRLKVFAHK